MIIELSRSMIAGAKNLFSPTTPGDTMQEILATLPRVGTAHGVNWHEWRKLDIGRLMLISRAAQWLTPEVDSLGSIQLVDVAMARAMGLDGYPEGPQHENFWLQIGQRYDGEGYIVIAQCSLSGTLVRYVRCYPVENKVIRLLEDRFKDRRIVAEQMLALYVDGFEKMIPFVEQHFGALPEDQEQREHRLNSLLQPAANMRNQETLPFIWSSIRGP